MKRTNSMIMTSIFDMITDTTYGIMHDHINKCYYICDIFHESISPKFKTLGKLEKWVKNNQRELVEYYERSVNL